MSTLPPDLTADVAEVGGAGSGPEQPGRRPVPPAELDPWVFRRLCAVAREHGGIELRQGKEALVSARVAKRLRVLGLATPRQYLRFLESDDSGVELNHFLDVITTNVTAFFREPDHLDRLGRHLRRLTDRGVRRLRLWSAACASGEEAYSMAIVALEATEGREVDLKILATDISTPALDRARRGVYSPQRLEPLTRALRIKYFERQGRAGAPDELYHVRSELRSRVVFKRLNLARPPFPMRGPLDAVLCRNVMIYLHPATRQALLDEIGRLLGRDGLLMIGHSESLGGLRHGLDTVGPSVYAPAGSSVARAG